MSINLKGYAFMSTVDEKYMRNALAVARQGLGRTAPNPSVGCVIVRDGVIVGRAHTAVGGRPHAERIALEQAGRLANGSTVYVTLEPCSFEGKSGACVNALIDASVRCVVIAVRDPHCKVNGQGIQLLESAGIEVVIGVCEQEAAIQHMGFFRVQEAHRPMVTVKLATSVNNVMARRPGESQWITGELARHHGHLLRYNHDAILVGSGTVLKDNPQLICRLHGAEDATPIRIILDSKGVLSPSHFVINTAHQYETWVVSDVSSDFANVKHIKCDPYDVRNFLTILANEGITRLLVEGGAQVVKSFFQADCVDQCYWYQSQELIEQGGVTIDLLSFIESSGLIKQSSRYIGDDMLHVYC